MEIKYAISIKKTTHDILFKDTVITYLLNGEEKQSTVESLFEICANHQEWIRNGKHYSWHPDIKLLHYNPETDTAEYGDFNYLYKHQTSKQKWEIVSEDGKEIIVTEDHSCMVERNGELIEVKPNEILDTDILLVIE